MPMRQQRGRETLIAIAAVWLVCSTVTRAGDWPNYRGPNHNGISDEVNWQGDWGDAGPKVLWQALHFMEISEKNMVTGNI